MKRYGVLFALIMVGSMVAQGDEEKDGSFLRRSDSMDISPRRESGIAPVLLFSSSLALRASLRKEPQANEGVLVGETEEETETHALFEFEGQFFSDK